MDYEVVRAYAAALLIAIDDVVRERRQEHHGDLVDGVRLALRDAAHAVGAPSPLTSDCTPANEAARRNADHFNRRLGRLIGSWHGADAAALAEAVWYVREGLSSARPCTIDVAILEDLHEFGTLERFAEYRAHIENIRVAIARL